MDYLVQFFAWLMEWCHSWCPNYWADIVIFTFFTKVLQFPVSLWCQVNSLKMVSLMPFTNRIAIEHYGDKDAIGDETAALFKREHYHPLIALVPLAIQIVILMAFVKVIYGIGDKLGQPGLAKPLIACIPMTDGGLAWLMPLFAGAAAWLLGYSQNIFNPLQHEQTRAQQLTTNGISICISLFLGMFVAAGVGLYWATSNVMSIVVQLCENLCIPPKKHVDYVALRRSQAELKKFEESIKSKDKVTPADKRREKEDYRRFFTVANKHVVFYAEGGGFYKYFKTVIDYLLTHSNLIIHYVTNDPKDKVLAQDNPRLMGYYIGPQRIIPLMMKMDAQMVVMTTPDLNTYHIKRSYVKKDAEYVYLDHGPTSVHMCYRKGAFDHFDTILCNGPFQVAEHRATEKVYGLKAKKLVETGYAFLDTLVAGGGHGVTALPSPDSDSSLDGRAASTRPPRIMIANSHQKDNIFDSCLDDLIESIAQAVPNATIVIRPHPQYVRRFPARWQAIREKYGARRGETPRLQVVIEDDFSQPSTMDQSAVLITDWSGIAYEFAYKTHHPTLFVDTPMKVINPEWQRIPLVPTDISFRDEVGRSVALADVKGKAGALVAEMLAHPDTFAAQIDRLFQTQFFNVGHAGEAAGKYIIDALAARSETTAAASVRVSAATKPRPSQRQKRLGNPILRAGAVALALTVVFFVALPLQSYLLNAEGFEFGTGTFWSFQGPWTLGAAVVFGVIFWMTRRDASSTWLVPLGLALALCALLEAGPLSVGLPEVDGHISVFKSHFRQVWDLAAWLTVVGTALGFRRFVTAHAVAFSLAILLYAAAGIGDARPAGGDAPSPEGDLVPGMMSQAAVLDSVAYSPTRNVFLLITDAASADVVADTLRANPEIAKAFDGFVDYENNVGMHWPTRYAIPGIFTGKYYDAASDMDAYRHSFTRRGSFLEDYLAADVPVFLDVDVEAGGYTNRRAENAGAGSTEDCRMKGAFAWTAGEIAIFRTMPYVGKRHYLRRVMHRWRDGGSAAWFGRDRDLWRVLSAKGTRADWPCTLQIHHSWGLHHPISFGRDGVERGNLPQTYARYLDAAVYVYTQLGQFMEALRAKGLYDSATIVIAADHGGAVPGPHSGAKRAPAPAYPLLMVKVPHARGPLAFSPLPTTHAGLSAVFRESRTRDLTREDVERILLVKPRFVRYRDKGVVSTWILAEEGTVVKEEK